MSKKALVIIGLAAVIAASSGMMLSTGNHAHPRGADGDPVSSVTGADDSPTAAQERGEQTEEIDEAAVSDTSSESTSETSDPDVEISETSVNTVSDNETPDHPADTADIDDAKANEPQEASLLRSFEIQKVTDNNTGSEVAPAVVFGKFYHACFLDLYSNSTLEVCLNPSTGGTDVGVYTINDHLMSVDFDHDRYTEYTVTFDGDTIENIIVSFGEYNIFFG